MSSRPLNNDRTNYLIWRYLQEHGHAQTAARFQMDWGNEEPDNLPFSQYIRTHSLVYLLQKGLRYHELELSINQTGNGVQPFFGPEQSANAADTATTRKHGRDSIVNGIPGTDPASLSSTAPAAKRSRRSNNGQGQTGSGVGAGSGNDSSNSSTVTISREVKSGDAMDVDEPAAKRETVGSGSGSGSVHSPPVTTTATAPGATAPQGGDAPIGMEMEMQMETEMGMEVDLNLDAVPKSKDKVFQRNTPHTDSAAAAAAAETTTTTTTTANATPNANANSDNIRNNGATTVSTIHAHSNAANETTPAGSGTLGTGDDAAAGTAGTAGAGSGSGAVVGTDSMSTPSPQPPSTTGQGNVTASESKLENSNGIGSYHRQEANNINSNNNSTSNADHEPPGQQEQQQQQQDDSQQNQHTPGDSPAPPIESAPASTPTPTHTPTPTLAPAPAPMPVPMPTLKDGRSVGVQSDKVSAAPDLGPETAVLPVPGKNVTLALWSPRDPTLLATGGDALCRLWALPSTNLLARSGSEHQKQPVSNGHANHPNSDPNSTITTTINSLDAPNGYGNDNGNGNGNGLPNGNTMMRAPNILHLDPASIKDLEDADVFDVTAMAWDPDGERIAFARQSRDEGKPGRVTVHSKNGDLIDELPGGSEWVLNLYWNPSGTRLLGISHSGGSNSTLMVWDVENVSPLAPLKVEKIVLDAVWQNDRTFMVCGENLVAQTNVQEGSLEALRKREDLGESQEWSKICHDSITGTTVVASESKGTLIMVDNAGTLHTTQAHTSEMTALKFQPLANPNSMGPDTPRLFATGGADGTIYVWDAKKPWNKVHKLSLGEQSQTLALSFTPDGYLIAAASMDRIIFWDAEAGGTPKAVWTGSKSGLNFNSDGTNGHAKSENGDVAMVDAEPEASPPSLSWDADGGKIAFTTKEAIAIVSLHR